MADPEMKKIFSDIVQELAGDMADDNEFIVHVAKDAFREIDKLTINKQIGLIS